MSSSNDTVQKTLIVATLLCIVCSVFVSASAVLLRKTQEENKALDRKKNILLAAGLFKKNDDPATIPEIFQKNVETKVVDLATGEYNLEVDTATFDQREAAKDPATGVDIAADKDIASIRRRSKYALVYLVKESDAISQIILPVHGMGLWGTLYGFLALDKDTRTVRGLAFYEHKETPGLGGEVENERWKALWRGKKVFDAQWNVRIEVVKGVVDATREEASHQVDGLAGATITSRGVTNLLRYWLGEEGFGTFFKKLRERV